MSLSNSAWLPIIYDREASIYDFSTTISGFARMPTRLARTFRQVAGPLAPNARLFDFGCGTGRVSRAFIKEASQNPSSINIIGLEPSRLMRAVFVDKMPVHVSSKLINGGYNMPGNPQDIRPDNPHGHKKFPQEIYSNGPYDVIASSGVFDHIRVNESVMRDFVDLLRPGGHIAFTFERKARGEKEHETRAWMFEAHRADYIKRCLTSTGAEIRHESSHLGYWFPRIAPMGMVIARKPDCA